VSGQQNNRRGETGKKKRKQGFSQRDFLFLGLRTMVINSKKHELANTATPCLVMTEGKGKCRGEEVVGFAQKKGTCCSQKRGKEKRGGRDYQKTKKGG